MPLPLTVIVPVKNEEVNLAHCLRSVERAGEIIVIDSHSTDRTAEIAEQHGAQVVQFAQRDPAEKKRNWALNTLPLEHEWVLFLDADERVPPDLWAEIGERLSAPEPGVNGYYLNRRLIFLGRWIRHCGWYPSWNLRLFRHRCGRYEQLSTTAAPDTGDAEVHEHVILDGRAGYLRHDLLHEDFKSVYHYVARHNRYSNWEAREYANLLGRRSGEARLPASLFGDPVQRKRWLKRQWVRLPLRPLLRFMYMYVIRLGWLDGRPGLIFCLLFAFHEAMISAKMYEMTLAERPAAN